jgi:hypothetical protein
LKKLIGEVVVKAFCNAGVSSWPKASSHVRIIKRLVESVTMNTMSRGTSRYRPVYLRRRALAPLKGTLRQSARAAGGLMMSSNAVDYTTGKSREMGSGVTAAVCNEPTRGERL